MEDTEVRECRFCDLLWAGIGIGIGLLFLGIGIDLMTQGKLSTSVNKIGELSYSEEEIDE
jgi:hypothetical protein